MPASLRDVRVVSPAVNLPLPLAAALLIAGCAFAERHGLIPRAWFRARGVPLIARGEFGIPDDNLNVNGTPPPSGTRSARPARMLTGLPRELERSPSRYGLQAICGTASAAVIERQ